MPVFERCPMLSPKSKCMTQRKNLDLFLPVTLARADWQLLHFTSMNLVFRWNSRCPELEVCLGTDENKGLTWGVTDSSFPMVLLPYCSFYCPTAINSQYSLPRSRFTRIPLPCSHNILNQQTGEIQIQQSNCSIWHLCSFLPQEWNKVHYRC